MIFLLKTTFSDILIVFFSVEVGRIQIKKADRAIILPNQLFKILILDDHLCKPSMGLLNDWEVASYVMGLATEAGEPGSITVSYQLIKLCRSLHVILNLFCVQY